MALVFISYARSDELFVRRLAQDLEDNAVPFWLDQKHIEIGQNWDDEIDKALRRATHMLFVLSKFSARSQNVRDEYNFARDHDLHIVPIRLDDAQPHFRMARHQYIDFRTEYSDSLVTLLEMLPTMRTVPLLTNAVFDELASFMAQEDESAQVVRSDERPTEENRKPDANGDSARLDNPARDTAEFQLILPEEKRRVTGPLQMDPVLHFEGENIDRSWKMSRVLVTFGRREDCDLVLTSHRISRIHAQLMKTNDKYFLRDMGSTNGTWLNGERISKETRQLKDGDIIDLAHRVKIRFELPHLPSRTPTDEFTLDELDD